MPVQNLRLKSLTESKISIEWDPYPCDHLPGKFKNFIFYDSGTIVDKLADMSSRSYEFANLKPLELYDFSVVVEANKQTSAWASIKACTGEWVNHLIFMYNRVCETLHPHVQVNE